ncbi:MAG: prepilin peptidase [Candidatus Zixiibacteriota bacterium]|nr:MAG: prepilin peptidase [candidate division Zixibacteria bacterium]
MEIISFATVGVIGLAVGSFLNVVIYRLPRKIGFFWSRSICPACSEKLKWYHNIPLISFLGLRGKCAYCGEKISFRYPLIESLNALVYLYFFWQFNLRPEFFIYSFLASVLVVVFFIDLDFMIIPDSITLPGIVLGLAVSFVPDGMGIVNSLIGMLVGGGSLWIIAVVGDWLFKKESMGGGDIKLAAMLGAFLGWQKVLLIFISSAFIGLVVSVVIMFFSSKLREKRMIPFGPFLALAAILAICYGDQIISFYVNNFLYS